MSTLNLGRVKGNTWYVGDKITGSSTTPTAFSGSGITYAIVNDMYLNTTGADRGNVYQCDTPGDADTALWVYVGSILGAMPEVVNNLTTNSSTKALSAAMGKKLKDLLDSCGVQPYTVTPTSGSTAFTASMVIEDFDTTFTVTDMDGNTGTYAYTNGGGTTATVNITIGTSIGLPNNGAVIKAINSSGAKIISYALYDSASTEIFSETPSLWDHLTADEQNIIPYSDITEGLNTYKSGLISKIISGVRTTLYPVTHAAAVWFNRGANKTVKDAIDQAFDNDADEYDSTSTYAVGDICIYQGALYRCTTAIAVAEAWDATHWTATTVGDEIGRISSDLSGLRWNQVATVTADGTKTWNQILLSLGTQVGNGNRSKEYMLSFSLSGTNERRSTDCMIYDNGNIQFQLVDSTGSGILSRELIFSPTVGVYRSVTGSTRTDESSTSPSSGAFFKVYERDFN